MARFVAPSKIPVHDGHGTNSRPLMTGHGAPPTGAKPGKNRLLSNNWGASGLKKLQTRGGAAFAGQNRFVQPTDASTAQVPPPGLGDPHGDRSTN